MKISNYFIFTYRNVSNKIKLLNNKFLFKSNLINQVSSGIYIYTPLFLKIIRNIIFLIKIEIEKIGFSEILFPSIQPIKLFDISKRRKKFKLNLFYINKNKKFVLSPTNEEILSFFLKDKIKNLKLPINLYQISNKYRNELRSSLSLFRAKEFLMKDGYSLFYNIFDCKKKYEEVYNSYIKIFNNLKLNYKIFLIKDNLMNSSFSHEFSFINDFINYNNLFRFSFLYNFFYKNNNSISNLNIIYTPNLIDFFLFSKYLNFNILFFLKLNIYVSNLFNNRIFLKFIYIKCFLLKFNFFIKNLFCSRFLKYIELIKFFNLNYNYIGFNFKIKIKIKIFIDKIINKLNIFLISFFKKNYILNVINFFILKKNIFLKIKKNKKKIEIAHIFQLGNFYLKKNYSKIKINNYSYFNFLSMNSYGIGISRLSYCLIEQNFDKNGIIWPFNVFPFKVILYSLGYHYINIVKKYTDKLYFFLIYNKIDVILDDRIERLGLIFNDWDLIGVPFKIILSEKNLKKNIIEFVYRKYLFSSFFNLKQFLNLFLKFSFF